MGSDVAKTVVEAGLVEDSTLGELGRWGRPRMEKEGPDMPPDVVPLVLERAMQEEAFVQVRETDLEVLQQFLRTRTRGLLHIEFMDGRRDEFELDFGVTPMRELIIPWDGGDIAAALTEGLTYLEAMEKRFTITDVRSLYFGDQQAFLVCRTR